MIVQERLPSPLTGLSGRATVVAYTAATRSWQTGPLQIRADSLVFIKVRSHTTCRTTSMFCRIAVLFIAKRFKFLVRHPAHSWQTPWCRRSFTTRNSPLRSPRDGARARTSGAIDISHALLSQSREATAWGTTLFSHYAEATKPVRWRAAS